MVKSVKLKDATGALLNEVRSLYLLQNPYVKKLTDDDVVSRALTSEKAKLQKKREKELEKNQQPPQATE